MRGTVHKGALYDMLPGTRSFENPSFDIGIRPAPFFPCRLLYFHGDGSREFLGTVSSGFTRRVTSAFPLLCFSDRGESEMLENDCVALTIIVVDDCEDIRMMLRVVLERRGYRVLEAENGRVAVELARRKCPDLILMDLDMPVLDGFAATRRLRELDELYRVPIIAVSANPKDAFQADALAAGCNEYISKPVDFDELGYLMNSLLAA
jgi:two-component system, cell cycle response regulator DivK